MKNSKATVAATVSKAVSTTTDHMKTIKREASRRCRARAALIAKGVLLTPELAVRTLQPTALKLSNFKMVVGNKTIRLNKNGGDKVAMVITEAGKSTRKSFKDMQAAITAFNVATAV